MLSPGAQFEKWVINPLREIVDSKFEISHIKIIGFPKGARHQYIDYVNKTGVDAVAIDTSVNQVGQQKC